MLREHITLLGSPKECSTDVTAPFLKTFQQLQDNLISLDTSSILPRSDARFLTYTPGLFRNVREMARGRSSLHNTHTIPRKKLLHWDQRTILPDQTIENMSCDYNGVSPCEYVEKSVLF